MRNKIISLFLSLIMVAMLLPVSAFATSVDLISEYDLELAMLDTFEWAKQGHDILLNEEFLQCVGMTDGDWFPINMGIYGYEPTTHSKYLTAIEANITAKYATAAKLDRNKATEWHRIALAVTAMGGDPTSIGKDANGTPINLIADGTYNCVISSVDRQGINGPIWALIALDSKQHKVPADAKYQREDLIAMIVARQMSDGGFTLGGSATKDLPSDPDITAMALQALAPYQDSTTLYAAHGGAQKTIAQIVQEALSQMSKIQKKDGDFDSWGTENVESTAQMLVALTALGIDPYEDTQFIKNGNTLIDGILKYQLKDGGFAHSFVADTQNPSAVAGESNRMASEQAVLGLLSYYRFINDEGRLYDFTASAGSTPMPDTPDADTNVSKELPWFVLKETRLSGNGNELFVALLKDDVANYTIQVPYGFTDVSVVSTPFTSTTDTNFTSNNVIEYGHPNSFYYINKDGNRIDFTITLEYHYYAEPESIIRELEYLVSQPVTTQNKQAVTNAAASIANRYDALEFSYEKCYINAKVDVADALATIQNNIENAQVDKPDVGGDDDSDDDIDNQLDTLLAQKAALEQRFDALPSIDKVEKSDLASIQYVKQKANELISEFENIVESLPAEGQLLAQSAIAELEKMVALTENLIFTIERNNQPETDKPETDKDNDNDNDKNDEDDKDDKDNEDNKEEVKTHTTTVTDTKTIVTTKSFNSIIPKVAFDNIMGIDENVKGIGKIDGGKETCTFIFNGEDVLSPLNFLCGIRTKSENSDAIKTLSPDATIISLEHQGELPGTALLELETSLEDGDYILFSYDEENMQAVAIERVTVKDGAVAFLVTENQDYFIAKSAYSHSLLTENDETNTDEMHKLDNVESDTSITTNTTTHKKAYTTSWIVGISFIILAILLAIALVIMLLLRKKESQDNPEDDNIDLDDMADNLGEE